MNGTDRACARPAIQPHILLIGNLHFGRASGSICLDASTGNVHRAICAMTNHSNLHCRNNIFIQAIRG